MAEPSTPRYVVRPELVADRARLLALFYAGQRPNAATLTPTNAARKLLRVGALDHLRSLFAQVYGTATTSKNKAWLRRRLLEGVCQGEGGRREGDGARKGAL